MKYIFTICLLSFIVFGSNAQSKETTPLYNRLRAFSPDIDKDEIDKQLKNLHTLPKDKLADFYVALANYQYAIYRDHENANKHFYFALEQPIISDYTKADALNGIGTIYSGFFHHDLAIKNFKKSLEIVLNKYPDSIDDINSLYNNIGHSYSNENHKDSAQYYFKKGIQLGLEKNSPAMGCYFNMGFAHSNPDSAYYYTKKALDASIQLKKDYLLTFCYINLGANEISRGNLIKADSLLSLSEKNALKFKQTKFINEIKVQRARILISQDFNNKGIDLLKKVIPYFENLNDFLQLETIYIWLEKAYINNKQFEKAHWALRKYNKNIDDKENSKKLKKDQGIAIYKNLEKKLQSESIRSSAQKRFYLIIILLLLVFFSFAIYLFLKYKKRQHLKNSKLYSKVGSLRDENIQNHQQLLFKNLLVDEKQTFLKQLASDVKTHANNATKDKNAFLDIYKKIQQNIKDSIGNEFEYHFEKVHPNFYKSLSKEGYKLTKNEMRLAALIKLNFSTKEISEITKQSVNTINVAKSRLKTKLSLDKNTSLYSFIQKH